nr:hypothetical protein [Hymenobacter negativus]
MGYATTYQGNENGLVVEVHDARGSVTLTDYNEYNELVSEVNALGNTTARSTTSLAIACAQLCPMGLYYNASMMPRTEWITVLPTLRNWYTSNH